MLVTLLKRKR